jgi:endonuclease-8
MPEGPEVTYLAEFLSKTLVGNSLLSIDILRGRYINHDKPRNFDVFTKLLPLKCLRVVKKGKVTFMYFEKDWCIVSKLGMTGWWYDPLHQPSWRKMYPNIIFELKNNVEIHYADFRNFGTLTFYNTTQDIDKEINKLAQDILAPTTTFRRVMHCIGNLRTTHLNKLIEDVLIDQQLVVSGIGNYLKSEVLYDARISPLRPLKSITQKEWVALFHSMKRISKQMLRILHKDDVDLYMNTMNVYSKKKDRFGNDVEMRTAKTGRVTYWVPSLQK